MGDPVVGREESLALLREHMPVLRERFGVCDLALFGSTARDEATADSDVDVLVTFDRKPDTSWGDYEAQSYLAEFFGRRVDMVERHLMRKEYLPWVEADAIDPLHPRMRMPEESRPKRWDVYIQDMIDQCNYALDFRAGLSFSAYLEVRSVRYSVERCLEILCEAANKVPPHVRNAHPEIDWRGCVDVRNRITHDYGNVNNQTVWSIVHDELPALIPRLQALQAKAVAEAEASGE